jgi:hypothetical protein
MLYVLVSQHVSAPTGHINYIQEDYSLLQEQSLVLTLILTLSYLLLLYLI